MFEKIINNFDKYSREARMFPAILSLIPLYLLFLSFIDFSSSIDTYLETSLGFVLCLVLVYFFAEMTRNLGKGLENKVFRNGMSFPTTELLLHSNDTYSQDKKKKIYDKIKKEFGIILSTKSEESIDTKEARRKIKEAIGLIRQKLGNGRLLMNYNIRYGFWRNLCAAAPFALGACTIAFLALTIIIHSPAYATISIILSLFYLLLWITDKKILKYFGYQYAEQFYLEYLIK